MEKKAENEKYFISFSKLDFFPPATRGDCLSGGLNPGLLLLSII